MTIADPPHRHTSRGRTATRTLLVCGALAAAQAMISATASAVAPALAATMPPAYALIAGLHSLMPFLARRLTGVPWTATLTAGIAGALIWPLSAVGPLVLVVFLASACAFDVVLREERAWHPARGALAACAAALTLFAISLPVFSPGHLTPVVLLATFVARVVAELVALVVAGYLAKALRRIGVHGGHHRAAPEAPQRHGVIRQAGMPPRARPARRAKPRRSSSSR